MIESLVLAALGGVLGAIATYLLFDGISAATLGSNFTQVVFSLKLTWSLVVQGLILALIIGLVGGVFPAWRAARVPLLAAFKEQ